MLWMTKFPCRSRTFDQGRRSDPILASNAVDPREFSTDSTRRFCVPAHLVVSRYSNQSGHGRYFLKRVRRAYVEPQTSLLRRRSKVVVQGYMQRLLSIKQHEYAKVRTAFANTVIVLIKGMDMCLLARNRPDQRLAVNVCKVLCPSPAFVCNQPNPVPAYAFDFFVFLFAVLSKAS